MQEVICTVDVVLLTLSEEGLMVALHKREHAPCAGELALPGGYIHPDEDGSASEAAMRVVRSKTGLEPPYLEQLATFAGPKRDPRGWSVSIAHYALVPPQLIDHAGGKLTLAHVDRLGTLPFDHGELVTTAVQRLRNKSQYSSLPCILAGPQFTLPQLQRIYELLMGETINKVSFRRKITEMDILESIAGEFEAAGAHRPAQLYRLKTEFSQRPMLLQRGL